MAASGAPETDPVMAAASAAAVIVGTISASLEPRQASLVRAEAVTHLCTYSILEPSLAALADVLFGRATATGRLPVAAAAGAARE